ncbi:MAG: hypothetical protein HQK67_11585 [Desulfamplus sp.]|nr:hypothetical protein [Desulfamplus sp.]
MKTQHLCVVIILALTALITCNPLFASDNPNPPVSHSQLTDAGLSNRASPDAQANPIVSKTNYINGDIIKVTLPPNDLNKQRFVGITIPGVEELFLITDLNEYSLFDGQNLLSWAGQDKAIELEVTSDFKRGEYTVYLLQLPEYVDNPLEQTDLWEIGITTFNVNTGTLKPVDLGTAGNFVILAKAAVSNTGITSVTGNIGVSPAGL